MKTQLEGFLAVRVAELVIIKWKFVSTYEGEKHTQSRLVVKANRLRINAGSMALNPTGCQNKSGGASTCNPPPTTTNLPTNSTHLCYVWYLCCLPQPSVITQSLRRRVREYWELFFAPAALIAGRSWAANVERSWLGGRWREKKGRKFRDQWRESWRCVVGPHLDKRERLSTVRVCGGGHAEGYEECCGYRFGLSSP